MNPFHKHRTTNRRGSITETRQSQPAGKKKLEALQVGYYPGNSENLLCTNEPSNECELYSRSYRSPPLT